MNWLGISLTAVLVLLSGCGNNRGSLQAPSALSYSTATAVYTKGVQIAPNSPTSAGGAVTSYTVSPALPAGLSLSSTIGIVSGTPTAATDLASYTVTASNSAGSATATLTITVNDQPPSALNYTPGSAIYTKGTQIAPNLPTSSGGAVVSYSVSPALPAGLSLSAGTGIISGNPTALAAAAGYTVTASNPGGSATVTLYITVVDKPPSAQLLPNLGVQITPLAPYDSTFEPLVPGLARYPAWQAGQAVTTVVSPDGNTLLILTSGYNRLFKDPAILNSDLSPYDYPNSEEYVFIFDISKGRPVQKQVVTIPNSYNGIVFDPSGKAFYVSGGSGDYPFNSPGNPAPSPSFSGAGDNVHVFALSPDGTAWAEQPELVMNHPAGLGLNTQNQGSVPVNSAVFVHPCAAGVAISSDGQTLVVANYYNDSITVFTGGLGNWSRRTPDLDLRPHDGTAEKMGTPGGEYPFWVVVQGSGGSATAYVSSIRDREIDVVSLGGASLQVVARVPVKGQPNKMTMNAAQTRLYVAEDQSDSVDVIDISNDAGKNTILETIPVVAPASVLQAYPLVQKYTGANTNSVTLAPGEKQLWVTNGNLNSTAVVQLSGTDHSDQVIGLIPTGWYPNSVSFGPAINSPNGNWVYVVNGKSPTGPNAGLCYSSAPPLYLGQPPYNIPGAHKNCMPSQQYNPQLIKAGFQSFPQPATAQLATLTAQVATNNRFSSTESDSDREVMLAVKNGIKHVIFIIKENRGYDQVLGDLEIGNGDPSLTEFGEALTPNLHNLARAFVTLDNFMASSETSNDGWPWTTSARAPDVIERQFPVMYAGRGLSLDSAGDNRNVNVAIPTLAGRLAADPLTSDDPDLLPGQTDVAAPDGPDNEINAGYLWDSALRAGLTVRNYGFFVDGTLYGCPAPAPATCLPLNANLTASDTVVAYPANVSLTPNTDPYFRGFDNQFPDYYRFKEWERDFDARFANPGGADLPALSLITLMHDHTGNFNDPGGFGLNTPELQQADNDYAVALLVQKIANSVYKNNTLIFVIEDDSQDSGDHVDSHRTVAFVAGAYVKQQALVSTPYNTINFVRTIEEVLGLPPMNLNDALARPMADIFNTSPSSWSFAAAPSAYLYCSTLAPKLPTPPQACPKLAHTSQYWARVTKGMDFTSQDRFDFAQYNRILWKGLMGNRPYPATPNGKDLRQNRETLLARYRRSLRQETAQAPQTRTD